MPASDLKLSKEKKGGIPGNPQQTAVSPKTC